MIVQSKKWPHATDGVLLPVFICSIYPTKIGHMWLEVVQDWSSGHWTVYTSETAYKFLGFFKFLWYHFWKIYPNHLSLKESINSWTQTHNSKHKISNSFASLVSPEQMDYPLHTRNIKKDERDLKGSCSSSILKYMFLQRPSRLPF